MLAKDQTTRIKIDQVIGHPWLHQWVIDQQMKQIIDTREYESKSNLFRRLTKKQMGYYPFIRIEHWPNKSTKDADWSD